MHNDEKLIRLDKIIRQGIYSTYYSVKDQNDLIAKVVPAIRRKKYFGFLRVHYPMSLYTKVKFGIADMIQREYEIYQSLPVELKPFLPERIHAAKTEERATALCFQQVMDFDGQPSRYLYDMGPTDNEPFWRAISTIAQVLRDYKICLFSVFKAGYTIAVRRLDNDNWHPVLTDVHRYGKWMYYYRPQLLFDRVAWRKFENDYREFVDRYKHPIVA